MSIYTDADARDKTATSRSVPYRYSQNLDVVEVVRCKDCKWLDTYTINGEDITACNNENAFFRDVRCDEHCSCGERREDGTA